MSESPTPHGPHALQQALIAGMALTYLIAAGLQQHRGDTPYALLNLLIAALLYTLFGLRAHHHHYATHNVIRRRVITRMRREAECAWCGERIEERTTATAHYGAIEGEPFLTHHHPECEQAIHVWFRNRAQEGAPHAPFPPPGSMQRGQPHPRDNTE